MSIEALKCMPDLASVNERKSHFLSRESVSSLLQLAQHNEGLCTRAPDAYALVSFIRVA